MNSPEKYVPEKAKSLSPPAAASAVTYNTAGRWLRSGNGPESKRPEIISLVNPMRPYCDARPKFSRALISSANFHRCLRRS